MFWMFLYVYICVCKPGFLLVCVCRHRRPWSVTNRDSMLSTYSSPSGNPNHPSLSASIYQVSGVCLCMSVCMYVCKAMICNKPESSKMYHELFLVMMHLFFYFLFFLIIILPIQSFYAPLKYKETMSYSLSSSGVRMTVYINNPSSITQLRIFVIKICVG